MENCLSYLQITQKPLWHKVFGVNNEKSKLFTKTKNLKKLITSF